MSGFTRLTLVGSAARGDVAVPDDEPVGVLIPRLLHLLGEPAGPVSRPLSLVRTDGAALDPDASVLAQDVQHGEVIRIVRADEAPPPPEVAQVTDVLGASSAARTDRWTDVARARSGVLALGALAAFAVLLAARPLADVLPLEAAELVPLLAAAVAGVVAVACGLGRWTWGVCAATAVAVGSGSTGAALAAWPERATAVGWVLPVVTAVGLLGWAIVGTCVGLVIGRRGAAAGAAVGVVLLLVPPAAAGLGPTRAAAVGAVVAVLALGPLPRYALTVAGLPRLEDDALRGELSPWAVVQHGVDDAYAALTWSTAAVAVALTATVGTLATADDPWAVGLGAAVVVVVALRTRAFPLTGQHVALWGAVAAVVVQALAARSGALTLSALAMLVSSLAVLVLALVLVRPPEHSRATLRRVGNAGEMLAVVTLAPLLVGVFGVYADLVERFR